MVEHANVSCSNACVSIKCPLKNRLLQLNFGVHSPLDNYGHAVGSTETKFFLAARSTCEAISGLAKGWDIARKQ